MRLQPTARARGLSILGVEAALVTIEGRFEPADRARTEVLLTGLPDAVVRESRSRVTAALEANHVHLGGGRLYIHLAPAGFRKSGEALDLPMALSMAAATGHIDPRRLDGLLCLGELGIDGRLQDVPGGLAAAELVRKKGMRALLAPPETAREASLLGGPVIAVSSLSQALRWIATGEGAAAPEPTRTEPRPTDTGPGLDAVRGHGAVKRALAVAAAGGHGLLMIGPPGAGKSLLARGLLRLLPAPGREECLEITKIHSLLGRWNGGLSRSRPFRAPHHSTSLAGLIGGGTPILPGEITLAHRGLLFLDELPEFRREALESLRQPLEVGSVLIARAGRRMELPARFQIVTAMNPCPCGYRGQARAVCRCSPAEIHRYRRRVSGPLLDRIELRLEIQPPGLLELGSETRAEDREDRLRERVQCALALARERQGSLPNADLDPAQLDEVVPLDPACRNLLERVAENRLLSARGVQSLRRVARTIADLAESRRVEEEHLAESVALRAPILE